ncbi:MAG: hypothetical protein Kow0042_30650 [Calditrichia bacterium]
MKKRIAVFSVLFIFLVGCYTVIKHPAIMDEENPQYVRQIYFSNDCMSCHQEPDIILWGNPHPYLPRLNYINENERWDYYYHHPWWYRDMFYQGGGMSGNSSSDPLPTTSARNRFPGSSNVSGGTPPASSTSITGGGSSGGTRITGSGSQSGSSENSTVRDTKSSEESRKAIRGSGKTETDNSRNVGRRKKK